MEINSLDDEWERYKEMKINVHEIDDKDMKEIEEMLSQKQGDN